MQRKLASIQTIAAIEPISGADRIEQAKIMGWTVVTKKGEFQVGDRCVFFEIDSVLPSKAPWAQFMAPRKFRVKTITLRGVLSQGLALPVAILPKEPTCYSLEEDVTVALGVTKYEPPAAGYSAEILGHFPSLVPKTAETRLQSALGVLEELKGYPFYCSVKCDGTSATYIKFNCELIVCSRRNILKDTESNPHWRMARAYDLEKVLDEGYAIQGELCGPSIQKNPLGLKELDFFVFNVFDIKAGRYLDFMDFILFCGAHELKTVPIDRVVKGDALEHFDFRVESFLTWAKGKYEGSKKDREGIVVRPLYEMRSSTLYNRRLSFKVLNNDHLLKED